MFGIRMATCSELVKVLGAKADQMGMYAMY